MKSSTPSGQARSTDSQVETDVPTLSSCEKAHVMSSTRLQLHLQLLLTFGKLGAVTFGGGYAMIALMEHEVVTRRQWISVDELLNIITIAESTPGPIAVNMATFVGYRVAGVPGSLTATLALVFPAWLCIVLLASCYNLLHDFRWIAAALAGIRIAAIVLIAQAFFKMGSRISRTWVNGSLCIGAFALTVFTSVSAILIILAGLLFGILWYGVRLRRQMPIQKDSTP
ncbi:MAG: chromate transporter [Kiritimatiellia bacterium]